MDTRTDRSKVTVAPTEFKLVKYDPDEIADVAADLAGRIGLANPIRIVVDETTPMARMASTIDGTSSDALITIHVESGALEDTKRFTNFNRHHAEVVARPDAAPRPTTGSDRISPTHPTTTRCRCARRRRGTRPSTAASNDSASTSTGSAGCTTFATGSDSPTTSTPTSNGCGRPTICPGRRSTPTPDRATDIAIRSGPGPEHEIAMSASAWIAVVPDGVRAGATAGALPADAGDLAARRPVVVAAVRPPLERIEVVRRRSRRPCRSARRGDGSPTPTTPTAPAADHPADVRHGIERSERRGPARRGRPRGR